MYNLTDNQINQNKNEESIKQQNEIPVTGDETEVKKERNKKYDYIRYAKEASQRLYNSWNWNANGEWTSWERKIFNEIKEEQDKIGKMIETLELAPEQEKIMEEIQKQLEEQPIKDISIDFSYSGQFKIVDTTTGEIIIEDKAEIIRGFLKVIYKMQQGQVAKSE